MVKRVIEMFEDDLEGGKADVTVSFALEGAAYEIDLSEGNAQRLREALQPFVSVARPAAPVVARKSSARSVTQSPAVVRGWARENGFEVNERGRIPSTVLAAFLAANGS